MFALCGNRTRDLLRRRRVFSPLRQIGRQFIGLALYLFSTLFTSSTLQALMNSQTPKQQN
jgi:hypothetical protein